MRLLILNGNPDPADAGWESSLDRYAEERLAAGDTVSRVNLRDLSLRFCTGCWSCWYTTPGLCALKDDMEGLCPQILGADVTVWASPLVMGNVTALTKKAQDRFIPLLHPYFALDRGEVHHRRRYAKNIDMGLLVRPGTGDTAEDIAIVRHLHERLARNGRGRLALFRVLPAAQTEARHEAATA